MLRFQFIKPCDSRTGGAIRVLKLINLTGVSGLSLTHCTSLMVLIWSMRRLHRPPQLLAPTRQQWINVCATVALPRRRVKRMSFWDEPMLRLERNKNDNSFFSSVSRLVYRCLL